MNKNWNIRKSTNNDAENILDCRRRCFPDEDIEKQQLIYWEYEFIHNYAGQAQNFVAEDNKRIIGFYGVIPQNFIYNDEHHSGAIVVDVMTDPDYRKQGLFVALGEYAIDCCINHTDVEFATGYTVRPDVMPGHIKVGWKLKLKINTWIMPLSVKELIAKQFSFTNQLPGLSSFISYIFSPGFRMMSRLLLSTDSKHKIKRLCKCDKPPFDSFWTKFKSSPPKNCLIQERTSAYLSWRYDQNPCRDYTYHIALDEKNEIMGFVVSRASYLLDVKTMIIVDALFLPDIKRSAIKSLLLDVRDLALKGRCSMCAMMVNQPSIVFPVPWHFGFIRSPYQFNFITRELKEGAIINNSDLNVHLMWGDTDDV
jgi:GNAT superfamily N-acetyltransferase